MLSLQLKSGEYLTIGDNIVVQVFEQSGSAFRVAIKAPREIPILRGEVHERIGERPDGLHSKRPKSPSERRYNAKRLEEWAEKKEVREEQNRRAEEEKVAVVRELIEVADHMGELVATNSKVGIQSRLDELRSRLNRIAEITAQSSSEETSQ